MSDMLDFINSLTRGLCAPSDHVGTIMYCTQHEPLPGMEEFNQMQEELVEGEFQRECSSFSECKSCINCIHHFVASLHDDSICSVQKLNCEARISNAQTALNRYYSNQREYSFLMAQLKNDFRKLEDLSAYEKMDFSEYVLYDNSRVQYHEFHSSNSRNHVNSSVNSNIPNISYQNIDVCAICLDGLLENQSIVRTRCGHMFHEDCLKPWTREHSTCPYCRQHI